MSHQLLLGALLGVLPMVRISLDPRPYLAVTLQRANQPVLFKAYGYVTLAGASLFGIALLQSSLPRWLGYLRAIYLAVMGAACLVTGQPGLLFGVVVLFYVIEAVVGIGLLWRPAARIMRIQQQAST